MALIINRLYFPRKFCSLTLLSSSGVRGFLLISILQSFASSTFSGIIGLKRTQQFDCFFQFQRLRVYCVTRYFSGENSPRSCPNICEDLVPDTDKGANLVFLHKANIFLEEMRMICQYHFNHNLNSFKCTCFIAMPIFNYRACFCLVDIISVLDKACVAKDLDMEK